MAAFKFSNKDQTLTVYNLSSDTCELIGVGDCFVPANTGLPAYCTNIKPSKEKAGFAVVFDVDNGTWQYVAESWRDLLEYTKPPNAGDRHARGYAERYGR